MFVGLQPATFPVGAGIGAGLDETMFLITDVNLSIGDWVCATAAGHVTNATAANLPAAGCVLGVAIAPGFAGFPVPIQVTGLVNSSITGLVGTGDVIVNPATGRAALTTVIQPTDYPIGTADNGHITMHTAQQSGVYVNAGHAKYNLDPTGIAPAGSGIQAAINDAAQTLIGLGSSSRVIQLPPGVFNIDKPLYTHAAQVVLRGAGPTATLLQAGSAPQTTNLYVGPLVFAGVPSGTVNLTPNAFAGGNAMQCRGTLPAFSEKYIEIGEHGAGFNMNGATAWELEMVVEMINNNTLGWFLSSFGVRKASDGTAAAFIIANTNTTDATAANSIIVLTTTASGSTGFLYAPGQCLVADGKFHTVKINYDSSFVRVFVDQVLILSVAHTGAVVQKDWETVMLGRGGAIFLGTNEDSTTPDFDLASIIFRNAVTQTASTNAGVAITGATNASPIVIQTGAAHGLTNTDRVFISGVGGNTAANGCWNAISVVDSTHFSLTGSTGSAAYTSGGTMWKFVLPTTKLDAAFANTNTTFGMSFDQFYDVFCIGVCRPIVSGGGWNNPNSPTICYLPTLYGTSQIAGFEMRDMALRQIYGYVIEVNQCSDTKIDNIFASFIQGGIRFHDNCYNSSISRVRLGASGDAKKTGIKLGGACWYTTIDRTDVANFLWGFASYADFSLDAFSYIVNNQHQVTAYQCFQFNIADNTIISDEGSGGIQSNIIAIGCQNMNINGLQIISASSTAPIFELDGQNGLFSIMSFKAAGTYISPGAGTTGLFQRTLAGPVTGYIELDGSPENLTANIPLLAPGGSGPNIPIICRQKAGAGVITQSIAGLTTFTVTNEQWVNSMVVFTGALTANCVVTVPAWANGSHVIVNNTTGAFTLTAKASGSAATPITCAAGRTTVQSTGVDLV